MHLYKSALIVTAAILCYAAPSKADQREKIGLTYHASGITQTAKGAAEITFLYQERKGDQSKRLKPKIDKNTHIAKHVIPRDSDYILVYGKWTSARENKSLFLPIKFIDHAEYRFTDKRGITKVDNFTNTDNAFYISLQQRTREEISKNNIEIAYKMIRSIIDSGMVERKIQKDEIISIFHQYDQLDDHKIIERTIQIFEYITNENNFGDDYHKYYIQKLADIGALKFDGIPTKTGKSLGELRLTKIENLINKNLSSVFNDIRYVLERYLEHRNYESCVQIANTSLNGVLNQGSTKNFVSSNSGFQATLTNILLIGSRCIHREHSNIQSASNTIYSELDVDFTDYVHNDVNFKKFSEKFLKIVEELETDYLFGNSTEAKEMRKYHTAYRG